MAQQLSSTALLISIVLVSACAADDISSINVRVHDNYIEVDKERYASFEAAKPGLMSYSGQKFIIEVHPCTNAALLVEVVEFVKPLTNISISIGSYGTDADPSCS